MPFLPAIVTHGLMQVSCRYPSTHLDGPYCQSRLPFMACGLAQAPSGIMLLTIQAIVSCVSSRLLHPAPWLLLPIRPCVTYGLVQGPVGVLQPTIRVTLTCVSSQFIHFASWLQCQTMCEPWDSAGLHWYLGNPAFQPSCPVLPPLFGPSCPLLPHNYFLLLLSYYCHGFRCAACPRHLLCRHWRTPADNDSRLIPCMDTGDVVQGSSQTAQICTRTLGPSCPWTMPICTQTWGPSLPRETTGSRSALGHERHPAWDFPDRTDSHSDCARTLVRVPKLRRFIFRLRALACPCMRRKCYTGNF